MKIGIMSDSHGDRRAIDRAVERAGKVDLWLHAGDCVPDAAYLALVSAVRVENVAGNTDWPDGKTPDEIVVEAAGHRIFLTHGHIYGVRSTLEMLVQAAKEAQADIAVYGHTHVAQEVAGDVHVLNPGSVARPRDEALRASLLLASMSGWMTWVLIRSPMSFLPFRATMSWNEAPLGMMTGGAKSSLLAYLSLMYLMNSMNRT